MKKFALTILMAAAAFAAAVSAQGTEFTFQGKLNDGTNPANAGYDFEFRLYDAASGGTQIGAALPRSNILVANGIFTVNLDFGNGFPGADRHLEIRVRTTGGGGFSTLNPRQKVGSSPYAIKSLSSETANTATNALNATNAVNSATAANALQLGGVAANQFVLTTDSRMTDARNTALAGSPNYVQNRTDQQVGSNFNVSGTGMANIFSAATQYNIGGNHILSAGNSSNSIFAGRNVGTTGGHNSFFGWSAGQANISGTQNSFFGSSAGASNTTGGSNVFLGFVSGTENTTGIINTFVGALSGNSNTVGNGNSFFGHNAGAANTMGFGNTFIGVDAGNNNSTGSNNTIIGYQADFGAANLSFATAIGAQAVVSQSNTVVLGRPADIVRVPGSFGVVGALTTNSNLTVLGTSNFIGAVDVATLGSAGGTDVCRNASNQLSTCSSSLRYKSGVIPFFGGLDIVRRLRPITFYWKDGGMSDVGFGAEDVNAVEPLLATYNDKGEIEGVKYKQITTVLVNAVKEQQKQIDEQKRIIQEQRADIDALKAFVCLQNPAVRLCGLKEEQK